MKNKPTWIKDKKIADDFEVIQCKPFDHYKDHKNDDGCYVLLRVYRDTLQIGVAICNYEHVILKEFRGSKAQDIYHAIFEHCNKNNLKWFTELQHVAYLGKELKKAEICLVQGSDYIQE